MNTNLVTGIHAFRAQFGYFRFVAFEPYFRAIRNAAAAGHPTHLVLGSNGGSLIALDVQRALPILAGPNATLTVVALAGAEFHPKTIQILRADASMAAIVGSSNWTQNGFGANVEASIVLDTASGDDQAVIESIGAAAERWHTLDQPGVFPILDLADIQALVDDGIINVPQAKKPAVPAATRRGRRLGKRIRGWVPVGGEAPPVTAIIPPPAAIVIVPPPAPAVVADQFELIWHGKKLKERDLSIPAGANTNPTGSMLWKKGLDDIDQRHWFRDEAFGALAWEADPDKPHLERVWAAFTIVVLGENSGTFDLKLSHNTRTDIKSYIQRNSMTQIHWGTAKQYVAQRELLGRSMSLYRKNTEPPEYLIEIA